MLTLYNSLTRKKEPFKPLVHDKVTMYVCGITPYDTTHLGHAFTYISFDMFARYFKYKGFTVLYTQNVTDINDRDNDIIKKANEKHTTWQALGDHWTKRFLDDMQKLNWIKPTFYLKASEHIPHITVLIQKLLDNNHAYLVNGSVYLDIKKSKSFGKLSRLSYEAMIQIAKDFEEDIQNPDKRDKLDITLWRGAVVNQPKHIPLFDSPFGKGRPGWHIECSAMAIESLGEQIDIHGGGKDLLYPHHESEIVQSEGATKKTPFASYWLHTGIVSYNGRKMSKSLSNLVMVSDLLKKYSPHALRFVLLSNHYRQNWEFQEEMLVNAEKSVVLLRQKAQKEAISQDVLEAFEDDLNIPLVLSILQQKKAIPEKVLTLLGLT